MIVIEVNNSYSQVKNIQVEDFKRLRKLLSYTANPQAAFFAGGFNHPRYLIDKKGYFPTGLLTKVLHFCTAVVLPYKMVDLRKKPAAKPSRPLKTGIKPYPDQLLACEKALKHGRGGIVAPTGAGKSIIIALIAARLNLKTLVVVPTLGIKQQLIEALIDALGPNNNVTVENIDSNALKTPKDYSALIIDECHHAAAKTYRDLNKKAWANIYYRFFLSATFFRNQQNEQLLFEGLCGEEIFRITQKEAVAKGYIVPVEAYYYNLPKQPTDAFTYAEVYSDLVVNNSHRNLLLADLLLSLEKQGKATLCLVREIAHGQKLSELTGIPFANGQDDSTKDFIRQFNNGGKTTLIGTTGVLGEGIDTKPAEYVIIAGLGKAKSAFMQQVGRGVRRYPGKESAKIILFRDSSHKFLLRHFREQAKVLKEEYGIEVLKLEG